MKKNWCILLGVLWLSTVLGQETPVTFEKDKETQLIGDVKHRYTVSMQKGEFLQLHLLQKNVNIQVLALSPEKDTIKGFNSNYTKEGTDVVEFKAKRAGNHIFEVSPYIPSSYKDTILTNYINRIHGSYVVDKFDILSKKEHQKLLALRKVQQDSAISWVKNESITLKGVKAEIGLEDLMPLKSVLKDVQIVGLGETSHGTHEIFQMKHRMLEFLVKEMGFTIFAIEASHIGCKPINDYVLHGKGNSREALGVQGFWIWNTEEVIAMIEWMRAYNTTVPEAKKVQFVGIDTQMVGIDQAYANVAEYIEKTKLEKFPEVAVDSLFSYLKTTTEKDDLLPQRKELYSLLSYLVLHEIRLVYQTSRQEYQNVVSDLRKIIQGVESGDRALQRSVDHDIRDEYMAQTTFEVLKKENPNAKMVLWAHNGHIDKKTETFVNGYQRPIGSILKEYLGDKYYAIGFSTYEGSFQARDYSPKHKKFGTAASFQIVPLKEGSLDWCFTQTKKELFFINFNIQSPSNAVHTFLHTNRRIGSAGANWTFEYDYTPSRNIAPGESFDGMIFIKETSAAVLSPGGKQEIERRLKLGR